MKATPAITRECIIDEATRLFQGTGYKEFTFSLLASRLGCPGRVLSNYFPDSDALLMAVIRTYATRHLTQAVSVMFEPGRRPIREKLLRFGLRMLLVLQNDRETLNIWRRVLTDAAATNIGPLFYEAGLRETLENLTQVLDKAMITRELRHGNPAVMAQQLIALLNTTSERRLLERERQSVSLLQVRKMSREAVDLFLYGATGGPVAQAASKVDVDS